MTSKTLIIGGIIGACVSFLSMFCGWAIAWVLCPQALVVMFVLQSRHAYDSLGAVGLPDLIVGVLYYPVLSRLLVYASRRGRLNWAAWRSGFWHVGFIGLAFLTAQIRNRLWGIG